MCEVSVPCQSNVGGRKYSKCSANGVTKGSSVDFVDCKSRAYLNLKFGGILCSVYSANRRVN